MAYIYKKNSVSRKPLRYYFRYLKQAPLAKCSAAKYLVAAHQWTETIS